MSPMPTARTFKHRGVVVAPRLAPWSQRAEATVESWGPRPRALVAAVFGLWPLTLVALAGAAMCWAAVVGNAP